MSNAVPSGAQISGLRHTLHCTQAQFAGMLGVHPITISKWERDVSQPPPYNIQQLEALRLAIPRMTKVVRDEFTGLVAHGRTVLALNLLVALAIPDLLELAHVR